MWLIEATEYGDKMSIQQHIMYFATWKTWENFTSKILKERNQTQNYPHCDSIYAHFGKDKTHL